MIFLNFPLMLVPLAVYNLLAVTSTVNPIEDVVFQMDMASDARFSLNLGEALIVLSLLLLFAEIMKATRISSASIVDHLLSTFVFIIFLVEFLLVGYAATSTFFILMVITLIDVVAGYSVSIRNASRDLTIDRA